MLVSELELLIGKLPRPDAPVRPRQRSPRQSIRQLSADQVDAIVAGYRAGATLGELGELHGLDRRSVAAVLKGAGVPQRKRGLTLEEIDEAASLYAGGRSLARVAEAFGVDAATVRYRLLETGVAMRDTNGRER